MSTITLPNIRVSSDLTVSLKLKDSGVAIDWSTLSNIKVSIYSDAQRALAGRCSVAIDAEDSTLLVCTYAANKPQYVGVNRVVVSAKYMNETKTYDKPAFNFVRWTDDQEGQTITIDDPDIDVEISVEDVSSSILQEAVDAANTAAERANEAAEAAEHMVDIHTGPAGKSPYIGENGHWYEWDEETHQYVDTETNAKGDTGETPDISIGTVTTVEPGTPAAASMGGTPEAPVLNLSIPKGAVGATPNITVGTVTTGEPGTPVVVTITGTPEAPVLNVTIPQGMQGNTGSSVEYPYELVNNLTTDDATKGLSAAQGKVLDGKVSQLEAKVVGKDNSAQATISISASAGNVKNTTIDLKAGSYDFSWDKTLLTGAAVLYLYDADNNALLPNNTTFGSLENNPVTISADAVKLSIWANAAISIGSGDCVFRFKDRSIVIGIQEIVTDIQEKTDEILPIIEGKDNSAQATISIVGNQGNTYLTGAFALVDLKAGQYDLTYNTNILAPGTQLYVCYSGSDTYTLLGTLADLATITLTNDVWRIGVWAIQAQSIASGDCVFRFTDKSIIIPVSTRLDSLENEVDGKMDNILVSKTGKNLFNPNAPDIISGAYINGSGTLVQNSTTANVSMSGMIPFSQEQGNLILSYDGGGFTRAWYGNIVYYNANKEFISASAYPTDPLTGVVIATWFSGVAYVRFLIRLVDETISKYQVEEGTTATALEPYAEHEEFNVPDLEIPGEQLKNEAVTSEKIANGAVTPEKIAPGVSFPATLPAISLCGLTGETTEQASLSNSALVLTDWPEYIKASGIVSIEAKITAFNTIYLGVGNAHLRGRFIKIDSTNLYFGHAATTPEAIDKTSAHGLTIGTFIKAVIIIDGLKTTAIISTLDGAFKNECTLNDVDASRETYGLPYVKADSSTSLTDVRLNANCRKYKCPVWVFGDSMASEFNERWAYYTRYAWGFDYYLDALAGGNSATLFADLELALEHGTPKYLVWMLGANDLLNNNESAYKNYVEQVEEICESRGVELILLKFPSFPEVDPTSVNTWMIARGHRYIDFYRAVGSDNSGNWYPGYMGSDNRHPTELGAMAEASQFCVDFPEIMQ